MSFDLNKLRVSAHALIYLGPRPMDGRPGDDRHDKHDAAPATESIFKSTRGESVGVTINWPSDSAVDERPDTPTHDGH